MFGLGTLPLSLMLLAIMLSINNHASAQIGITLGLQPSYSEQVEATMGERVTDFPMFIMQHGTVGVFFRFNTGGRLYFQPEVNASLDANWSYASAGNGAQEEFERAFETLKSIHIDVPVYVGVKVLSMKDLKLRVFGCPQWRIRYNTEGSHSEIAWNHLNANLGVGVDVLSFLTFNVNCRVPVDYGHFSFDKTMVAGTVGFMF